jgi:ABC-type uncharacterized transport system permease subunit
MTPLFLGAAGLYSLATIFYFVHLFGRSERTLKLARWSLAAALLVHLALIGLLCTRKLNPLRDVGGALSLSAWLLGIGYLATTFRSRMAPVGAFIAPLALVLLVSSFLARRGVADVGDAVTLGALGMLHIALASTGVAAFGLAAAVAVIYLFQEASLKRKRIGMMVRHSPPLTVLDRVGRRLILVGFPLFTLALLTGVAWVSQLPGHEKIRMEYLLAGIAWVTFALLILARITVGWRGRPAAWATLLGFLATLVVLMIYLGRRFLGG